MSTIHTQGRITVRENGEANSYAILDDKGQWLLSLLHNGQQVVETQRENLRRLVACWNACEGISTIRLERTVNNLHGRASASDRLDELRAQRDELQAQVDQFRALAKANGEALGATIAHRDELGSALKSLYYEGVRVGWHVHPKWSGVMDKAHNELEKLGGPAS